MDKKIVRERSSVTKDKIVAALAQKNEALAHKDFQIFFGDTCDRVTIYRALDRLVEEGKIHKITGIEGVVQYALCSSCKNKNTHNHDHVHFNCLQCGKVVCLDNSRPKFDLPEGYQIKGVQCMVSGICPDCN